MVTCDSAAASCRRVLVPDDCASLTRVIRNANIGWTAESAKRLTFEGADEQKSAPAPELFDYILMSVGRRPNGREIKAEAAGVNVNERGYIPVDKQLRTNVAHIFAIGDICGEPMLAHKATHEGKTAAEKA